ncbi:MAG: NUDIX domain-containing protein [Candidatus Marinimicrobia bacterium]|jgi:dATP pyrophosphohydrolase|nr:NUDIX domain-containing protein [Candidatus Neomarinimicrobiota bacterium]
MPKIIIRVIDAYVYRRKNNEIEYLLLKRAKTKKYEHLWQGVAGKIEEGETAVQAAVRELNEETGFHPVKMFVADHVSKFYEAHDDRINLVPVFGIEVDDGGVTLSREHCDFKWVEFEIACKTLVWKGQKEGISAVHSMLILDDDRIKWSEVSL